MIGVRVLVWLLHALLFVTFVDFFFVFSSTIPNAHKLTTVIHTLLRKFRSTPIISKVQRFNKVELELDRLLDSVVPDID